MQAGLKAGSVSLARQSEEKESGRPEQSTPRVSAARARSNRSVAARSGDSSTSSASDAAKHLPAPRREWQKKSPPLRRPVTLDRVRLSSGRSPRAQRQADIDSCAPRARVPKPRE